MDLILIRHGLPERSSVTADPSLSQTGRHQAVLVAAHMAGERIDAIWSSTMQRAKETAEPLASRSSLNVASHHGICEYDKDGGDYVPDEVLKAENYEAWKAMAANGFGYDMAAFQAEVVEGLEHIISEHPGQRVAVFCHGGVINVWAAHVLGLDRKLFFEPNYTSVSRFACGRNGARSLISLNEDAHLRTPE